MIRRGLPPSGPYRSAGIVIVSQPMPEVLNALLAFVAEHQRCGELDRGLDNGYVWLQCSCGGLIMHPASEPPKTRAGDPSSHHPGKVAPADNVATGKKADALQRYPSGHSSIC